MKKTNYRKIFDDNLGNPLKRVDKLIKQAHDLKTKPKDKLGEEFSVFLMGQGFKVVDATPPKKMTKSKIKKLIKLIDNTKPTHSSGAMHRYERQTEESLNRSKHLLSTFTGTTRKEIEVALVSEYERGFEDGVKRAESDKSMEANDRMARNGVIDLILDWTKGWDTDGWISADALESYLSELRKI